MPDFEDEINELLDKTEEEIQAFEIDVTKEELIQNYRNYKIQNEAFFNWIESNQNEIYCIKGDAGTGKTTFVHYLQYKYKNTNVEWDIIDMNMSLKDVKILSNKLIIPRFSNVYFKSVSIFIKKIVDDLFYKDKNKGKINIEISYQNISKILTSYNEIFDGTYPTNFVKRFFAFIII